MSFGFNKKKTHWFEKYDCWNLVGQICQILVIDENDSIMKKEAQLIRHSQMFFKHIFITTKIRHCIDGILVGNQYK